MEGTAANTNAGETAGEALSVGKRHHENHTIDFNNVGRGVATQSQEHHQLDSMRGGGQPQTLERPEAQQY